MSMSTSNDERQGAKVRFFDGIAEKWDGWEDLDGVAAKLSAGLDELGVGPGESVVDVGCGTGNLTKALLQKVSPGGRIVAVDFSPEMVSQAKAKVSDPQVEWHVTDVTDIPAEDESMDRVICFSVWPHFDDPAAAVRELRRLLGPSGKLHVWHLSSRATINEIHASAGEAVCDDVLGPAEETANLIEGLGFSIEEVVDDDVRYLVTATKKEQPRAEPEDG
jgi:demethylmenaquinone methyltransferase/2-methoxy-6-polyprenyl-1,4-benzoquinol methylase